MNRAAFRPAFVVKCGDCGDNVQPRLDCDDKDFGRWGRDLQPVFGGDEADMEFEIAEYRPGRWVWMLVQGDRIPVARSETEYPSRVQARAAVAAFADSVSRACDTLREPTEARANRA